VRLGESLDLPWFLPGTAIALVVSLAVSGVVGRALRVRRPVAWVMVLSMGVILAATITPQWEALAFGALGTGSCDFSRIGLAPQHELLMFDETSLNILLFVPLGASIAFIRRSKLKVVVLIAAIALPFAIEITQLLLPVLDRACESADVVDNLTGLVLGLGGGVVAGRLARSADRQPE
jgi:hypothetical protein